MITVTLACGCRQTVTNPDSAPRCDRHGETRVQAVQARAPRFTGTNCTLSGPCVVPR